MTDRLTQAREALAAAEAAASGPRPPASVGEGSSGRSRRGRQPGSGRDGGDDPHGVARAIVLRQLTMGPRSRAELEKKLAAKDCDPKIAADVLDRMEEVGLVDDTAYAEALVRSKRAGRGLAKRALAHELRRKGVDDDIVDDALSQVDRESEMETARALVEKRLRQMHGLDAQTQARRLGGMLARKGYPPSIAYAAVRDAVAGAPEHQRD